MGHYPQLPSTHKWKQLKQVERQKQHRLACFFLSHSKKKRFVCVPDEVSALLMNAILADVSLCHVGGAQERCGAPAETLQSNLPSCLPLHLRPSLSNPFPPLSGAVCIFPHHQFCTLFYPIPPTPPPPSHTCSQPPLYLSPSSSVNGKSV